MTRRHTRRWGLLQIGHSVQPPSGPIISTVSQTAGTINGGTVVTVTGSGFAPGMTSTLGTVNYVNGSEIQITTNAESAGAFSWGVTVAGQHSASQSFTFLAHPTVTSLSPNNGPQTLTTSGVVVTAAGLPATGTGCPVTCTVDGNAVTSVVLGSGHFTCTIPTDTSSGAKNVVVTVDGVASTGGTGAWTYNPPPSVSSVTSVGTSGGSATCDGANFVATPTASANINGTPTSLTVTWVSSTELVELLLVGGSYTAGHWDLTVTNPDGQSVTAPGAFYISTEQTPQTILGAIMKADLVASTAVVSGSNVVSVPDSSGNSNAATVVSSTPPTVIAASTRFFMNPQTILMSSANDTYLQIPNVALGGSGNMSIIVIAAYTGATNTTETLCYYAVSSEIAVQVANNTFKTYFGGYTPAVSSPSATSSAATVLNQFTGGSLVSLSVNNQPAQTTSVTGSVTTSGIAFTIGANNSSGFTQYADFEWAEIIVCNALLNSSQTAALCQYANDKYGVTQAPTFTQASVVPASTTNAPMRVLGAGFMSGTTASLIVSGSSVSVTVNTVTTTTLDCTIPTSIAAGTYDIVITNSDGRSNTYTNAVTFASTSTNAVAYAMNNFGTTVVGAYVPNAAGVTLNGSAVSGVIDQSAAGNAQIQVTGANQLAYHSGASDTTFNDQPYLSGNGTSQFTACSALNADGSTAYICYCVVLKNGATGALRTVISYVSGAEPLLQIASSGAPEMYAAGYTTWGSAISGAQNVDGLTSSTVTSINVANGTAVTTSGNEQVNTGGPTYLFSNSGVSQFGNMSVAAVIVLNATPNSTKLGNWHSFCQSFFGTT